jgi:hypothetical protein
LNKSFSINHVLVYVNKKNQNLEKQEKTKKHQENIFIIFFTLLYTITSSWCGRFDTPCIGAANYFLHPGGRYPWLGPAPMSLKLLISTIWM